jgi:hypothetical protein
MPLIAMEGKRGAEVKQSLEDALARSGECDSVVVIMQKKIGGLMWFAPDGETAANTMFLCHMMLAHFTAMLRGE